MNNQEAVFEKLNLVYDPELDKSVLEMKFIEEVDIHQDTVTVVMRLPTFWCSPNFAFIMAEDIRNRVMELPWVSKVLLNLKDHCSSEEINKGVSEGKSFEEVFSNLANGDLNEVRKTFQIKSFKSRQEHLLRELINFGVDKELLNLTIKDLNSHLAIRDKTVLLRYLTLRSELGFSNHPNDLAFLKHTGERIDPLKLSEHLLEARRTRLSMDFNANHCLGLLETRYQTQISEEEKENKYESCSTTCVQHAIAF
ncbi:metal-sulfur cluster assembly factor [Paenisporosarcina antarctica]|uniref:Iron-sulfur cluster assembly protein n=1 Tax=Paenisporosarcina antarctica TaxID=417367 RepID=A0A4P6ZU78_9BACL|nr:iron-sulfur cluster assembly protein [Paenisporosarcina antarctica]QBP39871.1 iron-sulfur cluster assembly protein [Paenisporosarcina antarctica]